MTSNLPFERSIGEFERRIAELRINASEDPALDVEEEIRKIEEHVAAHLRSIYSNLTPWQRCQIARHFKRPHSHDFVAQELTDFVSLAGDRVYAEDVSVIGGIGRLRGRAMVVIGQEKGHDTDTRVHRNFGMVRPEGYRKATRLMDLADRFGLPLLTIVDTPGASPDIDSEKRGQAEAIARTIEKSLSLGIPNVALVLGEGGSGGAVALACANRVLMLEHAVYSVISPEGCASILWRSTEKAEEAATALRLTADNMKKYGVIDEIISEPLGGAHRNPKIALKVAADAIAKQFESLAKYDRSSLQQGRRTKFLTLGAHVS